MDSFKYKPHRSPPNQDRWGIDTGAHESDLLAKKDLQIKRLQEQLESQRKRADNALKMLDSLRGAQRLESDNNQGMKSEVSRRLKAEEQSRRLRIQNQKLRGLITQHIHSLGLYKTEIKDIAGNSINTDEQC